MYGTLLFLLSATPVGLIIKAAGSVRSGNPVDLSKQAEISGWRDLYDGRSRTLKIVAGIKVANEYGALAQPSNLPRNCESSKPRLDPCFGGQCEAFESEATKIRSMGDQRTWRMYSQHFTEVPATVEFIHEWTERVKL